MNGSLITADGTTHIKILVISLLASILVVWVGLSAHSTTRISHQASVESVLDRGAPFSTLE